MDQDITDGSDFAQTAIPQLTQLDNLLRCHVCKDFLRVPVLTPCGHTFCSLCIRQYLRKEPKCPLCLNELRESSLRSDFLVNEIVEIHKSSRKALLDILRSKSSTDDSSLIELGSQSELDDDLQILATNEKIPPKSASASSPNRVLKPNPKTQSLLKSGKTKNKEKLAQCPICQQFYPIEALERTHLDECLTLKSLGNQSNAVKSGKSSTPVLRKSVTPKPTFSEQTKENEEASHLEKYLNSSNSNSHQRLPKITFASMSMSQIKQKLGSLGLPITGSRQNMIDRYDHYEMLWNSNFCDSIQPVDENELKRQLLSWEASRTKNKPSDLNSNSISSMMKRANAGNSYQKLLSDFKSDKFERKSWILMFNREFKSLVREARRTLNKKPPDHLGPETNNAQETLEGRL